MSHLTPEQRKSFDLQLDALREERRPGHIDVGDGKRWSVIWKRTSVLLTPLGKIEEPLSEEEMSRLPF